MTRVVGRIIDQWYHSQVIKLAGKKTDLTVTNVGMTLMIHLLLLSGLRHRAH